MFSCTEEGEDMSMETFQQALSHQSEYVTIGGGEPTIHPLFWPMLIETISHPYINDMWMATNGAETETALKLARLAKKGVIACALSQDKWHDPIDDEVLEAFGFYDEKKPRRHYFAGNPFEPVDQREIRCTEKHIVKAGRAIYYDLAAEDASTCECGFIVKPNGEIRQCQCPDSTIIGHVANDPCIDQKYWDNDANGYCYKNLNLEAA
jgi:MoaA/NifB/PqqE/SkfB family radical SAM enzyme